MLFTRHREGMWLFGEAVSLAQVEWRRVQLPPADDGMLWNPADSFDGEEATLAQGWVRTIRANIERILQTQGTFVIYDHQAEVMEGVLGKARGETHPSPL